MKLRIIGDSIEFGPYTLGQRPTNMVQTQWDEVTAMIEAIETEGERAASAARDLQAEYDAGFDAGYEKVRDTYDRSVW